MFEILTLDLMKLQGLVVGRVASLGFSKLSKCLHLQGQFDCLTLKAVQSLETSGITRPTTYF